MAENNCKCIVCGKEYYFCLSCNKRSVHPKPSWYVNYCSENCKNISTILTDYGFGNIEKADAEKALNECDLSGINSFAENIKEDIEKLQKKDKSAKPSFSQKKESVSLGISKEDASVGLMAPTENKDEE